MTDAVPVIDLFSGPGGLAEGFAALRDPSGQSRFPIALSIEMDSAAHRTLLLRAFLRKFPNEFPTEYYEYINGEVTDEPDWATIYPSEWEEATDETRQLELGTSTATAFVQQRIREIRKKHGTRTVLLGGPPCQSYSIAGRSRNAGNTDYNADEDKRQSLYLEYAKVLEQLQPAVAVMENVKGMLSAHHEGKPIFSDVMDCLCHAGGEDTYRLVALAPSQQGLHWRNGLQARDFVVRAEQHGIPQSRHRVFVICIRNDVAEDLPDHVVPRLKLYNSRVSVDDVIGAMPRLRSRLSRNDHESLWRHSIQSAFKLISVFIPPMNDDQKRVFHQVLNKARDAAEGPAPPFRDAEGGIPIIDACPIGLRNWIVDENLAKLPNNETRGHMESDLTRYLYAAAFACAVGKSPKASEFPEALAPEHNSWNTGKFHDRFRVQLGDHPSTTVTSHISKDGHYFIHPDPTQCRSLTVREAARLQTFPDNYFFHGGRTQQYVQVGNAVPPYLASKIAECVWAVLDHHDALCMADSERALSTLSRLPAQSSSASAPPVSA